ncbi:MAG: hypothetical protein ABI193_25380 [Minicystis sp.]
MGTFVVVIAVGVTCFYAAARLRASITSTPLPAASAAPPEASAVGR